jgi:paired amphipathic helix protein Sin3a
VQAPPEKKQTRRSRNEPTARATEEELQFFQAVKARVGQRAFQEFLKCLNMFTQGSINRSELINVVQDLLAPHPDLFSWFRQVIGGSSMAMGVAPLSAAQQAQLDAERADAERLRQGARDAWAEINFDATAACGPSYRHLPDAYPLLPCSGRDELAAAVLNDAWVSVPTGSEEYGFRSSRKNQYEESLFRCEEDRFEFDMLIELNDSLIRRLRPVLVQLQQSDTPARVKLRGLSILERRALLRTYGDKGEDVLQLLEDAPHAAVPVVLERLERKAVEWKRAKAQWQQVWRDVLVNNSGKALDHQSYAFKQADRKSLQLKALQAEITAAADRIAALELSDSGAKARKKAANAGSPKSLAAASQQLRGARAAPRVQDGQSQPARGRVRAAHVLCRQVDEQGGAREV